MRAVHCPVSDPVSFALLEGAPVARFARVSGWSAEHTAQRAVDEHRAWLAGRAEAGAGDGRELGRLLTAARAALFLQSLRDGEPELALTAAEAARKLAARDEGARGTVEEAFGRYAEFARSRVAPPATIVAATRRLMLALPAYAGVDAGSPEPLLRG
jgi:hypothetical protein